MRRICSVVRPSPRRLIVANHRAQTTQSVVELGWDDPHLVGVTVSQLRQHLHVLVGQQSLIRLPGMNGVEHGRDGLGLALGTQHLGLTVCLSLQDGRLSLTLGTQDGRLPVTAGSKDL